MAPKRKRRGSLGIATEPHVNPSADWTRHDVVRVHGRILAKGTEVSIKGERGRFRFLGAVTTPSGAYWLDFIGGSKGVVMFRAFRPEQIKRVHIRAKTRANHGKAG